ncbi:hypothetical protein H0H87_011424, partial [Tephrocybe sp. NHM501043]
AVILEPFQYFPTALEIGRHKPWVVNEVQVHETEPELKSHNVEADILFSDMRTLSRLSRKES